MKLVLKIKNSGAMSVSVPSAEGMRCYSPTKLIINIIWAISTCKFSIPVRVRVTTIQISLSFSSAHVKAGHDNAQSITPPNTESEPQVLHMLTVCHHVQLQKGHDLDARY